jgi:hypothetical protein
VAAGSEAFLVGHAPVPRTTSACLQAPASLRTVHAGGHAVQRAFKQLTPHFFSVNPNPADNGAIRATWQHSRDTSSVWAKLAVDGSSTDTGLRPPGAIAWLLLDVVGTQEDPRRRYADRDHPDSAAEHLGRGRALDRLLQSTDVGKKAFVPYTADYFFYRMPDGDDADGN